MLFKDKFQTSIDFIVFIILAMSLDAYAINWFDLQNKCRSLGQEMPSVSHHEKSYWTKYYHRQSHWIGK